MVNVPPGVAPGQPFGVNVKGQMDDGEWTPAGGPEQAC